MKSRNSEKEIYEVKLDPDFQDPYVDADEWRERELADGSKIPYRYMHGGFAKKKVKFSFCFPKKEDYQGRFYQYLSPFPGPDEETASLNKTGEDDVIAFCLTSGAYYVESNMGSSQMFGSSPDPTLVWKASAAAAEFSREKAMEIYNCGRPYGYVHGGSGGGYKTMACIENTNAWDGAVPYVIGSPVSLPNTITMHAQGQRVLRHAFRKIVDALDAGGSGNPYADLSEDEASMLKELTQMGFPPMAWFLEAGGMIDDGSLPVLMPGVKASDPSYFHEFWTVPGYMGADPASNAVRDRLQFEGTVKSVHIPGELTLTETDGMNGVDTAWKKMMTDGKDAWIELEEVPAGEDLYLKGVNIGFKTGEAVGKQLLLGDIRDNCLIIGMCYGMDDLTDVLRRIKPGDRITLDNSDYIAVQSYYRHQVPEDLSFHAWDQFRDAQGKPILPQRSEVMGYGFSGTGTVQDGDIQGKVIVVQSLMDESTCPWCGDWYRRKVKETTGSEKDFRIYYMEHCLHGDVSWLNSTMVTNYLGTLRQALLDVSAWVEKGIEPLPSTCYELTDGQIIPALSVKERKGMQPMVTLSAGDSPCARAKVGETVNFTVKVQVPKGAGKVTAIFCDTEADDLISPEKKPERVFTKECGFEEKTEDGISTAEGSFSHTYDKPGTYFVSVRAQAERSGDKRAVFTQVKNIARARVIVSDLP